MASPEGACSVVLARGTTGERLPVASLSSGRAHRLDGCRTATTSVYVGSLPLPPANQWAGAAPAHRW